MIAEVIVDLATNQTDKPFDYQVPDNMNNKPFSLKAILILR